MLCIPLVKIRLTYFLWISTNLSTENDSRKDRWRRCKNSCQHRNSASMERLFYKVKWWFLPSTSLNCFLGSWPGLFKGWVTLCETKGTHQIVMWILYAMFYWKKGLQSMGKGESQAPKNPFPTLLATPLHTVSQGYKSKNYLVTNFQLYRKM